ncbi:MAG TPA: HAMP domain-containing protein, partial [Deltaproteobacteria bacterium]|nr:HAMP domain-containing protein [Deltaproteobacteria bacterium]
MTKMTIRFSIKSKIFFIIVIPALILIFVIFLDYRHLSSLGRSAELILSKNYKSIQKAQQIRQILESTQNRILSTIFMNPSNFPEIPLSNPEIKKLLSDCNDNVTESGEQQIIDSLFIDFKTYESTLADLIKALNTRKQSEVDPLSYDFITISAAVNSKLNDLVLINERAMESAEKRTKLLAKEALRYSIGLLILAILFTLLFSYLLSTRISRPLIRLAKSLAEIKEGSGDYPEIVSTTRDEIGFLTQEFNRLFGRLKIYDQISKDKLTAEKLKARHAEEARARLIADLSHQLKTPMTSLSMSVGMLADKADRLKPDQRATLFETAREDCAILTALINELIDTARLEGMV